MLHGVWQFILNNWIELFGTVSGLIYIIFSYRHSVWLWPIGIATSAAYIIVFYDTALYADMLLQVYYLFVSVYGWLHWVLGKQVTKATHELKISRLKPYQWFVCIIVTGALTLLYLPFGKYFNAAFPLIDGFITAGSIVATWMLTRKIVEQWIFWVILDATSVILMIAKDKYPTAILMSVYTILAAAGYFKWLKDYKLQNND